jgi:hypothetical protein
VLTSDQKGAIAEAAIAHAALELGVGVAKPFGDERYDLIFDLRPLLVRVQCKWAVRRGEVIVVRCCGARRSADGIRRTFYSPDEIDAFAAYSPDLRRCYFLPLDWFPARRAIQLRLSPSRNQQHARVNWAARFEFAATLAQSKGP